MRCRAPAIRVRWPRARAAVRCARRGRWKKTGWPWWSALVVPAGGLGVLFGLSRAHAVEQVGIAAELFERGRERHGPGQEFAAYRQEQPEPDQGVQACQQAQGQIAVFG